MMRWYLIYTKPRQGQCGLLNLEQQSYECICIEKLRRGALTVVGGSLFARFCLPAEYQPIRKKLDSNSLNHGCEPLGCF